MSKKTSLLNVVSMLLISSIVLLVGSCSSDEQIGGTLKLIKL